MDSQIAYTDYVQALEREQPLRSCLGSGCCLQCGRPIGKSKAQGGIYTRPCICPNEYPDN